MKSSLGHKPIFGFYGSGALTKLRNTGTRCVATVRMGELTISPTIPTKSYLRAQSDVYDAINTLFT